MRSQGCHIVDLLFYLARSRPVRVFGEGANLTHPDDSSIDQMVATIRFENGSVASWIQGDSGTAHRGSKFSMELHDAGRNTVEIYNRLKSVTIRIGRRIEHLHRYEEEGLYFQNVHFVDCLRRNRDLPCTEMDGLLATLLVERCIQSSMSGKAETIFWDGNRPVLKRTEGEYR